MHWPKHDTGKRSCSIGHSAVRPTLPRVWRVMLQLPVEKGTTHKRHACVRKHQRCASRRRQHSSQLSVKHSNRWWQPRERHLMSQPLKGNGIQEQHSRRTKRLTMRCRMQVRNSERFFERKATGVQMCLDKQSGPCVKRVLTKYAILPITSSVSGCSQV